MQFEMQWLRLNPEIAVASAKWIKLKARRKWKQHIYCWFFSLLFSSHHSTAYLIGMCICAVRSYFAFHSHNCTYLYLHISTYYVAIFYYVLIDQYLQSTTAVERLCKMLKCRKINSKQPYIHPMSNNYLRYTFVDDAVNLCAEIVTGWFGVRVCVCIPIAGKFIWI